MAGPAFSAVLAEYNFNALANEVSNPSAPNAAAGAAGVFVSSLDSDAGGDGNSDGLGTITANETRDATPDTFSSMALAVGLGTTGRNPFANPPQPIVAAQDFLTFTLISTVDQLRLESFAFDYAVSVNPSDKTGLQSAAQLFYSLNAQPFVAVGERQERIIPAGENGFFTGFSTSTINLSAIPLLGPTDSIEFRLAFGDNSNSNTSSKGVYLDNLILVGDIVPEPAGAALLGLAGTAGLLRRRRSA